MRAREFIHALAKSLIDALIDDPFYQAITIDYENDAAARERSLTRYFEISINEGQELGVFKWMKDASGAAIWLRSQPPEVMANARTQKLTQLSYRLGERGIDNYKRITTFMSAHAEGKIDPAAWYLSILGVSPSAQGKGIGRMLVEAGLSHVDFEKKSSYVETFNERSLPFYNRLGFAEVDSQVEPVTGERYWLLVREAR